MSGTHGITRAMCLPPHTVLLAQMPRARASLSPSPLTEPPPKGVTELGTVGPTSRAADPGDTLLLRHQNNWGDPRTPKPRDTHFRVWGAGIPQKGLPRRQGNSVDPKTEGTPPNSLPAAPPKLRRPHAAAPRAPAARGPPTPRPFTLYHAHPPLIGQDSPRPFSLPRRHGRPPMNGGVPSSVCDVIDDVMYRPMGGGEAGLRGKQTPHVAAAGRGTRAGGDTGEGGGTASGPPLPVRREPRHARHRLGRPRAARSRGPGAADRGHPGPAAVSSGHPDRSCRPVHTDPSALPCGPGSWDSPVPLPQETTPGPTSLPSGSAAQKTTIPALILPTPASGSTTPVPLLSGVRESSVPVSGTPRSRRAPLRSRCPGPPGSQIPVLSLPTPASRTLRRSGHPSPVSIPPAPITGAPRCRCSPRPGVQDARYRRAALPTLLPGTPLPRCPSLTPVCRTPRSR